MNPKTYALWAITLVLGIHLSFSNQCDNYYAKVTYALSHSKKAMTATNFEHQMYYSERAMTALEKSKTFLGDCDCAKSEDKTLDAIESLNKAIEPVDWDAGRYFTKKSIGIINELITLLDECTLGTSTTIEDSGDTTLEHEAYPAENEVDQSAVEKEMVAVFQKHAQTKLNSTQKAIEEMIALSKTIGDNPSEQENMPNSLKAHKKAYLEQAKKLLEEGLQKLNEED
ncbi:hypothetical protein [Flagellimonas nanhaiensis]|uniref:Uncharacterized protein n=1 Tax=Flagellimonas nanhaiensis TaxID=2292706 RepID=A0A371JV97_9FLAO|nr:hypothetical protein [Allomuricauda nanhaiensis]RDY61734.1 hypothetical protein DX873_06185 [Allomuricauda nanhaiensis]